MTGFGKVLAVLFAVTIIGYFVMNAHEKANPIQKSGQTVDGKPMTAPNKIRLATPGSDKKLGEQKKADMAVAPATHKAQKNVPLKPRVPQEIDRLRPFIHSSKSGIMDPLPPKRTPLPGIKRPQKDAGSR